MPASTMVAGSWRPGSTDSPFADAAYFRVYDSSSKFWFQLEVGDSRFTMALTSGRYHWV